MTQALLFGLLASSAFPIGVALGLLFNLPKRLVAGVIAFGAGVLVVALTGELAEAVEEGSVGWAMSGLFTGAIIYILMDLVLDKAANESPRVRGRNPEDVKPGAAAIPETKAEATVSGMAVLVGSVLDGIPENAAIGMGLASDKGPALGLVLLGAVFFIEPPIGSCKLGWHAKGWSVQRLYCCRLVGCHDRLHRIMCGGLSVSREPA
jgi:ZIP family zinc transporter